MKKYLKVGGSLLLISLSLKYFNKYKNDSKPIYNYDYQLENIPKREEQIKKLKEEVYDLIVIGGNQRY
jgi:hypothetical protein